MCVSVRVHMNIEGFFNCVCFLAMCISEKEVQNLELSHSWATCYPSRHPASVGT